MIDAATVKDLAAQLGADLCGIATPDRFDGAPGGFHPRDIYPDVKSVIALARRVPASILFANSCVPYTLFNGRACSEANQLSADLARRLEAEGIIAVPVPSDDPYEYWEPENTYGRGILSMRHVGWLAGLGLLGKNTLLVNETYGNMIQIAALLANVDLQADPLVTAPICPPECRRCLDACPAKALDGTTVNQKLCRKTAFFTNERGFTLYRCNRCRKACPRCLGVVAEWIGAKPQ